MKTITKPSGVTLVEVAVATSLVAVVLVASLETLGGSMRTLREVSTHADAHSLAERMMAEALGLPYEDPDGNGSGLGIEADEPGTPLNRLAFDDVDDFDGLTLSPPQGRDGVALPGYDGWTQTWRVRYAQDEANGAGVVLPSVSDEGLLRVTVEVTSSTGAVTQLYAFRSRSGPADTPAPFDAQRVAAVEATIVVAGSSEEITRSATPTNLAEAP